MAGWNDAFWLGMAQKYADEGSKDPSTKVGCVIVRPDKTPCSWGTNGFPQGIADTADRLNDRETKYQLTVHAETNALLFAPERVVGYTLYSTFAPCLRCAVNIIQSKLARVVFTVTDNPRWKVGQQQAIDLFREAGIEVFGYDSDGKLVVVEMDVAEAVPQSAGYEPRVADGATFARFLAANRPHPAVIDCCC